MTEQINPFESLPNELLYEMCQQWDVPTLINMSQSYSRVYQVCKNIIEQRKGEYLREKQIGNLVNQIITHIHSSEREARFVKAIDNYQIIVKIKQTLHGDSVIVFQIVPITISKNV